MLMHRSKVCDWIGAEPDREIPFIDGGNKESLRVQKKDEHRGFMWKNPVKEKIMVKWDIFYYLRGLQLQCSLFFSSLFSFMELRFSIVPLFPLEFPTHGVFIGKR